MDNRTISQAYAEIGNDLILTRPELDYLRESQVNIVYLSSEHEKKENGKLIFGQCEKIPDKYRWAVPCDITITIFEPNVERFSEDQLRILLFHELLHIKIETDGNEEKYSINPHDVEDFRTIIDQYGIDWSNT